MIQVNLIPDVKLELVKAQRHRDTVILSSIIASAVAVTFLIIVALWVFLGQGVTLRGLTEDIKSSHAQFVAIEDIEKTVTLSNQMANIDSSHQQKSMTSRVFGLLNALSMTGTENSIAVSNFTINTDSKTMTITAQTETAGFEAVDVFRKNFEAMEMIYIEADRTAVPNALRDEPLTKHKDELADFVASDIAITNMAYIESRDTGERVVGFRVDFTYGDLLFDESVDLLRFEGLEGGNVTDSYQRLPDSLFTSGSNAEVKE